jgi:antimicrobial peptide system SdpB family protein
MSIPASSATVARATVARATVRSPWTDTYGLARTLIALTTLTSLLFDSAVAIFNPFGGPLAPLTGAARYGIVPLLGPERLELSRWIMIAILLVVISGWRPRVTGVLHWWVTFSFMCASSLIEGGDQLATNLTMLLVPLTLTDPRRSHWDDVPPCATRRRRILAVVGASVLPVVRLQMAVVYLHASIGKLGVNEWANGTALYYWFLHPMFGAPTWLRPWIDPLVSNGATVLAMTWGVIVFELVLASALFMRPRRQRQLFFLAVAFHAGIILIHGLASFFFAMAGGLVLYLLPVTRGLALRHRAESLASGARRRLAAWRRSLGAPRRPTATPVPTHASGRASA